MDVLLCFSKEKPVWRLTELAVDLGLSKTVTYRCLSTLVRKGFLAQDQTTRKYRLGLRLLTLGNVLTSELAVRQVALPVMKEVARETGQSVFLTVVDNDEAVCVERFYSNQILRLAYDVGRRAPLHAGASAKALLAFLPTADIERIIQEKGLQRFTDTTITDATALRDELALVRERGYALSLAELDPGVGAIGAPVMRADGRLVACLSIGGPVAEFMDDRVAAMVESVKRAAARISAEL